MPQTLLAKKSGPQDNAIATDDDHHEQLASDPTVGQFPQGSSFGATNATNSFQSNSFSSPTAFGSSPSGFGASNSFGQSAPGTTTSPSFGGGSLGGVSQNSGQSSVQIVQNQGESLKNTGGAMQEGADVLVKHSKESEDWINKKWRPVMGWIYMLTCTADFVIFPVLWSLLQALSKGQVTSQWQPLTLQGAGLYHIAMGAVLGIAAYGRTKEKLESKQ